MIAHRRMGPTENKVPATRAEKVPATKNGSATVWILASERKRRRRNDAILADRTRDLLRAALARHVPGTVAWVYGSLVKPSRFHDWSDVDVALESLPAGMTLEYLQSLLSADVGREVASCLRWRVATDHPSRKPRCTTAMTTKATAEQ